MDLTPIRKHGRSIVQIIWILYSVWRYAHLHSPPVFHIRRKCLNPFCSTPNSTSWIIKTSLFQPFYLWRCVAVIMWPFSFGNAHLSCIFSTWVVAGSYVYFSLWISGLPCQYSTSSGLSVCMYLRLNIRSGLSWEKVHLIDPHWILSNQFRFDCVWII